LVRWIAIIRVIVQGFATSKTGAHLAFRLALAAAIVFGDGRSAHAQPVSSPAKIAAGDPTEATDYPKAELLAGKEGLGGVPVCPIRPAQLHQWRRYARTEGLR
jgi:hypothetical protein